MRLNTEVLARFIVGAMAAAVVSAAVIIGRQSVFLGHSVPCGLPAPLEQGAVVVDVNGLKVSTVMSLAEAVIEADRWQSKAGANPRYGPYGWEPVTVFRTKDLAVCR